MLKDGYEFEWRAMREQRELRELFKLPAESGAIPDYFASRPEGYCYGLADDCAQIAAVVGPITEDMLVFAHRHTVEDPEDWRKSGAYIGVHEQTPLTCWDYSVYDRVIPNS